MATPWEAPARPFSDDPEAAPRKKKPPVPVPRRTTSRPDGRDGESTEGAHTPLHPAAKGGEALPPDLETDTGPENRVSSNGLASLQLGPDDKGARRDDPGTDPGWLIGLDQEGTIYLLGEPNLKIEQPPARVWQYNGNNCTLRLFLYLDMVTVRYRTLFYEIRGVDAEDLDAKRRCVSWLLADRSRGS